MNVFIIRSKRTSSQVKDFELPRVIYPLLKFIQEYLSLYIIFTNLIHLVTSKVKLSIMFFFCITKLLLITKHHLKTDIYNPKDSDKYIIFNNIYCFYCPKFPETETPRIKVTATSILYPQKL